MLYNISSKLRFVLGAFSRFFLPPPSLRIDIRSGGGRARCSTYYLNLRTHHYRW